MNMKNAILIILVFLLFIISNGDARAGVFPLKVERIAPDITQISNVADVGYVTIDAHFTPDGKYLIVSASGEFCVLPTANLDQRIENLDRARVWKGEPTAYLPSGKIVFSTVEGIYALDPVAEKIRTIYALPESEVDPENYYLAWRLVVLSDDLIISGDGDSADGSPDGNILQFDTRRGRRTRGTPIPGFYNPQISPSRRFILYEHGNGLDKGSSEIYDIARAARYQIARRFNLSRAFPKYEKISLRTIAWVGANTILAEVEKVDSEREISDATYISEHSWLVLLNVATGRIVWKSQPEMPFGASIYHQLSATKMLVDAGERSLYELSLTNGKVKQVPNLEGQRFALSPDRKKLVYFNDANEVFAATTDGSNRKKILDVPKDWKLDRWIRRPSLWSPDGKRLIVFDDKRFLFMRL